MIVVKSLFLPVGVGLVLTSPTEAVLNTFSRWKLLPSGNLLLLHGGSYSRTSYISSYAKLYDTWHFWASAPPVKPVPGSEITKDGNNRHILTVTDHQAGTTKSYFTFGPIWVSKSGAHPIGVLSINP